LDVFSPGEYATHCAPGKPNKYDSKYRSNPRRFANNPVADDVAHVLAVKRALGHAVSVRVATVAHLAGR
jgi:hypothetical protein